MLRLCGCCYCVSRDSRVELGLIRYEDGNQGVNKLDSPGGLVNKGLRAVNGYFPSAAFLVERSITECGQHTS